MPALMSCSVSVSVGVSVSVRAAHLARLDELQRRLLHQVRLEGLLLLPRLWSVGVSVSVNVNVSVSVSVSVNGERLLLLPRLWRWWRGGHGVRVRVMGSQGV